MSNLYNNNRWDTNSSSRRPSRGINKGWINWVLREERGKVVGEVDEVGNKQKLSKEYLLVGVILHLWGYLAIIVLVPPLSNG